MHKINYYLKTGIVNQNLEAKNFRQKTTSMIIPHLGEIVIIDGTHYRCIDVIHNYDISESSVILSPLTLDVVMQVIKKHVS